MSQLIQAMALLQDVFDKYAGKDADCKTLSKGELSQLLQAELGIKLGCQAQADKFFADLDDDKSGSVEFKEYVTFVAVLTTLIKGHPL